MCFILVAKFVRTHERALTCTGTHERAYALAKHTLASHTHTHTLSPISPSSPFPPRILPTCRYEMIQKVQTLQRRLIQKTEEVVEKELRIQEKEKRYMELKNILARQPGPEVAEQLQIYQQAVKDKSRQYDAAHKMPVTLVRMLAPFTKCFDVCALGTTHMLATTVVFAHVRSNSQSFRSVTSLLATKVFMSICYLLPLPHL